METIRLCAFFVLRKKDISKYAATWPCNIPCSSLRDLILFPNNIFPIHWVCIEYLC